MRYRTTGARSGRRPKAAAWPLFGYSARSETLPAATGLRLSDGGYELEDQTVAPAQRQEMLKWIPMVLFSMRQFREYVAQNAVAEPVQRERFIKIASHRQR
jgi:hypothetical protein